MLCFGTEPVIEIMTVFSATLFIECVSPKPNLLFKVGVRLDVCDLLLCWFFCHVGHSFLRAWTEMGESSPRERVIDRQRRPGSEPGSITKDPSYIRMSAEYELDGSAPENNETAQKHASGCAF
jgi:hypothetical protein